MLASQNGRENVVNKLIDSGANINQQAKSNGRSALYCCCGNNQFNVVKILVFPMLLFSVCQYRYFEIASERGYFEKIVLCYYRSIS